MSRSALASIIFLLGCATGGAASHLVEPVNAQPAVLPAGMPRWAYFCFKNDSPEAITHRANEVGKDGWELASSALAGGAPGSSPIWCFKRPYQ
jgi:hypothetical protein